MPNGNKNSWENARASALAVCSPDQRSVLDQIKSPEAARAALLITESRKSPRKSSMIMKKIQRALDGVKVFEEAMKVYSNSGVGELCLLWGSLTLILQVCCIALWDLWLLADTKNRWHPELYLASTNSWT
jgi:hypothetical protein